MHDSQHYPDFKCARPVEREAMKRAPVVYERETLFNVWNLMCLAGAFAAGWVGGCLLRVVG